MLAERQKKDKLHNFFFVMCTKVHKGIFVYQNLIVPVIIMFVSRGIPTCSELLRKSIYRFTRRINRSTNSIA